MQQAILTDALGYAAAGLVFATFCAKRMASLRALAIVSNVAFIGYGFLDALWPILVLHSAMLPMNIQRDRQSLRGRFGRATANAGMPVPSGSALLHNLITVSLGRLRSGSQRVIPALTFNVRRRPLKRGKKLHSPRALACLKAPPQAGRQRTCWQCASGRSRSFLHKRNNPTPRRKSCIPTVCVPRRARCDD